MFFTQIKDRLFHRGCRPSCDELAPRVSDIPALLASCSRGNNQLAIRENVMITGSTTTGQTSSIASSD